MLECAGSAVSPCATVVTRSDTVFRHDIGDRHPAARAQIANCPCARRMDNWDSVTGVFVDHAFEWCAGVGVLEVAHETGHVF